MPTERFLQRENAADNPVCQQALPTKSKHDLDEEHKKNHELALDQKAMREYEQEMRLYNQNQEIELAETFDTKKAVANQIKEQLKHWGLKYIQVQSSPRIAA